MLDSGPSLLCRAKGSSKNNLEQALTPRHPLVPTRERGNEEVVLRCSRLFLDEY
jgi:hypothetical protein